MRARRGAVLLIVLVMGIVSLSAAVSLITLANGAEERARTSRLALRADAGAITAVGQVLDDWPTAWRALSIGGSATTTVLTDDSVSVALTLQRLDTTNYSLKTVASIRDGAATRVLRLVRRRLRHAYTAPIASMGSVVLGSGSTVVATDEAACSPSQAEQPAFVVRSSAFVTDLGGSYQYVGSPSAMTVTDPTLTAARLSALGDFAVNDIASMANRVYASGTVLQSSDLTSSSQSTGQCAVGWGSPTFPAGGCESFYPIIYAAGTLTVNGGAGQGILVADGSVTFQNGALFWGLIVVRSGSLTVTGSSTAIMGRIVMLDPVSTIQLGAGATIRPSSCALERLNTSRAISRPLVRSNILDGIGMVNFR